MVKYLMLSSFMFFSGMLGLFVTKSHLIIMLMAIELIFLAMNMNFVMFSIYLDDMAGQMYSLCVLTVAAAESSMGLAMLMVYYSLSGGISLDLMNLLKG